MKKVSAISFFSILVAALAGISFLAHVPKTLQEARSAAAASVASAPAICPAKSVQHWDKTIFAITSPELALFT